LIHKNKTDKQAIWSKSGKVEFEKQMNVFKIQFELAMKLNRVCSVSFKGIE
jgi:hypothetical protein